MAGPLLAQTLTIHGDDKWEGAAEVVISSQPVKLGPFFLATRGGLRAVWQKLAKSFLFHARPFEVGVARRGGSVKRVRCWRIYCAGVLSGILRFQAK